MVDAAVIPCHCDVSEPNPQVQCCGIRRFVRLTASEYDGSFLRCPLLFLAHRDSSISAVVGPVPVGAVHIVRAAQTWACISIRAAVPEVPGVVTAGTGLGGITALAGTTALRIRAFDLSVFVDDITAIATIHPLAVANFLPLSAKTVLTKVLTLITGSTTEANASTGRREATLRAPAIVAARTVAGCVHTTALGWITGIVCTWIPIVAIQQTLRDTRPIRTGISCGTFIAIITFIGVRYVAATLLRVASVIRAWVVIGTLHRI